MINANDRGACGLNLFHVDIRIITVIILVIDPNTNVGSGLVDINAIPPFYHVAVSGVYAVRIADVLICFLFR